MSARRYVRSVQAITYGVLVLAFTAGTLLTMRYPTNVALYASAAVVAMLTCAFFFAAMTLPRRIRRRRIAGREAELARLRSAFDVATERVAAAEAEVAAAGRDYGEEAVAAERRRRQAAVDQRFAAIVHDESAAAVRRDQQWLSDFRTALTPGWVNWLQRRSEVLDRGRLSTDEP